MHLPPSRWASTADCAGVIVDGACWLLGGPGETCPNVCGGDIHLVDELWTTAQASARSVVVALTVRYSLPPWRRAETLDLPCTATTFDVASFLYLHETQTWGCFQGEDTLGEAHHRAPTTAAEATYLPTLSLIHI